jgi:hypothetical protein
MSPAPFLLTLACQRIIMQIFPEMNRNVILICAFIKSKTKLILNPFLNFKIPYQSSKKCFFRQINTEYILCDVSLFFFDPWPCTLRYHNVTVPRRRRYFKVSSRFKIKDALLWRLIVIFGG